MSEINFANADLNSVGFPLFTINDLNLYVDNINGDDSNDGSSGSPLKTLVEAEARLPLVIDHRVIINVLPYDASVPNVGSYEWPTFRIRTLRAPIVIRGVGFEPISSGTAQAGSTQLKLVTTGVPGVYWNDLTNNTQAMIYYP